MTDEQSADADNLDGLIQDGRQFDSQQHLIQAMQQQSIVRIASESRHG
jgi:hypothetical protein